DRREGGSPRTERKGRKSILLSILRDSSLEGRELLFQPLVFLGKFFLIKRPVLLEFLDNSCLFEPLLPEANSVRSPLSVRLLVHCLGLLADHMAGRAQKKRASRLAGPSFASLQSDYDLSKSARTIVMVAISRFISSPSSNRC